MCEQSTSMYEWGEVVTQHDHQKTTSSPTRLVLYHITHYIWLLRALTPVSTTTSDDNNENEQTRAHIIKLL